MASYLPPTKNAEYIFYICLESQSSPGTLQSNPTIASGDFTVSTDGGSFSNLDTLPTVTPASGVSVKVTVSATEMNGDNVLVVWADAAGSEWYSGYALIHPAAQTFDTMDSNIDSVLTDTAEIGAAGAGLTAIPWNASWDAEVQSECADALNSHVVPTVSDLNSRTLPSADYLTTADVNAEVVDVLRTDTIPDSYSAHEAQPTIAQAILEIRQFLQERSISSTTVTVKKPDGSTTAYTLTLNDASDPSSVARGT